LTRQRAPPQPPSPWQWPVRGLPSSAPGSLGEASCGGILRGRADGHGRRGNSIAGGRAGEDAKRATERGGRGGPRSAVHPSRSRMASAARTWTLGSSSDRRQDRESTREVDRRVSQRSSEKNNFFWEKRSPTRDFYGSPPPPTSLGTDTRVRHEG